MTVTLAWKRERAALAFASAPLVVILALGCTKPVGHSAAFSGKTALTGNTRTMDLAVPQGFRAAQQVLIHQGFTIESADRNTGLIKAVRNFQDPSVPNQSYNINATTYIFEAGPASSSVTLAASQQTILHREWHTWWHLLWIIPIFPTGTEYQTVVTKEGNITDPAFYADFFTAYQSTGNEMKLAEKAAADKAAAEKAAEEQASAAKAAALKAAAEQAAAEQAAAEQAAAEQAAAEQAAADKAAAEQAAAEQAATDQAAAEKAAADQAAAEKAAADQAIAAQVAAEKAAADRAALAKASPVKKHVKARAAKKPIIPGPPS